MQINHAVNLHQELMAKNEGIAPAAKHTEVYAHDGWEVHWAGPCMDWNIFQYTQYCRGTTNAHNCCLFFAKIAAQPWEWIQHGAGDAPHLCPTVNICVMDVLPLRCLELAMPIWFCNGEGHILVFWECPIPHGTK